MPRNCQPSQMWGHDQSHFTLWKAGQIKRIPGALPWFACADRPKIRRTQECCHFCRQRFTGANNQSDTGRQLDINHASCMLGMSSQNIRRPFSDKNGEHFSGTSACFDARTRSSLSSLAHSLPAVSCAIAPPVCSAFDGASRWKPDRTLHEPYSKHTPPDRSESRPELTWNRWGRRGVEMQKHQPNCEWGVGKKTNSWRKRNTLAQSMNSMEK